MQEPYRLRITRYGLFLGDEPFYLASGSMHYFRIHPTAWKDRLALMRAFGLTAVQTYVPWSLHEPREGVFDFCGHLNLAAFLSQADSAGLKVMLRPAPFINSEMDLGGLPWWLLKRPRIALRSSDPEYLSCIARYYARVCKEFIPYLSTRGGPILAIAIENEYGGCGNDADYLSFLRDCLLENGVDVPFYTTDCNRHAFSSGTLPGVWAGVNYRIESQEAIRDLLCFQPELPAFVGEYWSGRAGYWGTPFHPRDPAPIAEAYRKALDMGAYVNFYMFCGGTNFGFSNGSKVLRPFDAKPEDPERFYAITTSYDVNSLVGEDGRPTEKYYLCRRMLAEYRGLPIDDSPLPIPGAQAVGEVTLAERAGLFASLSALSSPIASPKVLSMEEVDQGYGYILYSTHIKGPACGPMPLFIDGLGDRAMVFANSTYSGALMRGRDASLSLAVPEGGLALDILVENLGRLSTSHEINAERKGIRDGVRLGGMMLYGWTIYPLPMDDLSLLSFERADADLRDGPAFYRGTFAAKPGVDTFLHLSGWRKGAAWINGFLLGRYDAAGPQETLYVPGSLLLAEENELILFETHTAGPNLQVRLIDHAILDGEIQNIL